MSKHTVALFDFSDKGIDGKYVLLDDYVLLLDKIDKLCEVVKTAEELAVKSAQEAGRLAAELDALRKQEPSHYAVLDDSGEIIASDTSKRALLSRGCAALGPTVELYASPVPPAAVADDACPHCGGCGVVVGGGLEADIHECSCATQRGKA